MMEFTTNYEYKITTSYQYYPDFSAFGYHIIQELGRNLQEGIVTYLAEDINSVRRVVIKEFCFANASADWYGRKTYEREIQFLQKLDHPRIPHYIDCFETPECFYLVQEYKNAPSLSFKRCFHPQEIKEIALSILDILVYLQSQKSKIIHRDIKPANILLDNNLQAYLVDFGLAKTQQEVDLSTLVAGTPGFIPPEAEFGYPLTEAYDLYSLGITLICLLTNTISGNISNLIYQHYRYNFQKLLPHISPSFRLWLKKMVSPNSKQRYRNATEAVAALHVIQVMGYGTILDNLLDGFLLTINQPINSAIVGLSVMGILLGLGTNLVIYQPGDAVNYNIDLNPNIDHINDD